MKKIGVLTYHSALNDGAILQALAQTNALNTYIKSHKSEIIDYRITKQVIKDIKSVIGSIIKNTNPMTRVKRYYCLKSFVNNKLPLSKDRLISNNYAKSIEFLKNKYDAIIVGADEVWKVDETEKDRPFPNIYWLDSIINSKKVALAASANRFNYKKASDKTLRIIQQKVNNFDLIGVRDEHTMDMLKYINVDKEIYKVPDPTFNLELNEHDKVQEKLLKLGLKTSEPIVGVNIQYGSKQEKELCKYIYNYFKGKGFQIVNLSLYNPYCDFDLRGDLTPIEWAHIYKFLDFCITNRFHGTIFSLKNGTPFITIDTQAYTRKLKNKTEDLLRELNLHEIHLIKLTEKTFETLPSIINRAERKFDNNKIQEMILNKQNYYISFIKKIENLINNGSDIYE